LTRTFRGSARTIQPAVPYQLRSSTAFRIGRFSHLLCVAFAALVTSPAIAATTDTQLWITTSATVKVSDKWRLSEEVITRLSDNRRGLYEVEMNSLLGYRLNKVVTVWAGYTHDPQYAGGHFTVMEHRAREQVTFDNFAELGAGKLSARIRTEQRWRSNAEGTAWRLRPFVRYTIPFHKGGRTAVTLTSEPLLNVNTSSFQTKSGLDRIRNLIAITTPIGKRLTGEFGYMNQHIFIDHRPDESDNIAWISVSASL
jgi:hypothetical protein